jgi:hypothetical protein
MIKLLLNAAQQYFLVCDGNFFLVMLILQSFAFVADFLLEGMGFVMICLVG